MAAIVDVIALNAMLVAVCMVCMWLFSIVKKNASLMDIFWGLGFVLIAWNTFFNTEGFVARKVILICLTTIWGLRLSIHILLRNLGKGEDPRYQKMRQKYQPNFWIVSLFVVFGMQGILMLVISLSVQIGQVSSIPSSLTFMDYCGIIIWIIGFFFESAGDYQLKKFIADPANKGRVMNRGLWAYTRHPNYFGEATMWWGLFLIALSTPLGYTAIASPLVITFLLLRVSGVALLEKSMLEENPEYAVYVRSTSSFIPWFRKSHISP